MTSQEQQSPFRGFQSIQSTHAAYIFNPEQFFSVLHDINTYYKDDPKKRLAGELYVPRKHAVLEGVQSLASKLGLKLPVAVGMTPDRIRRWQKVYPEAEIERVHVEFWTTNLEKMMRMTEIPPSKWPNFIGMGVFFGPAEAGYGVSLARELGLGINIHGNNIDTLASMGKLPKKGGGLKYVWGENGMADSSPVSFLYNGDSGLTHPDKVIDQVEKYGMDGFLYGADHERDLKRKPSDNLTPRVLKHLRAIHIAEHNHGEVRRGNKVYEEFIRTLARSEHPHEVALVFDNNPFRMGKMTYKEQLAYYIDTIDWLWEVQNDEFRKTGLAA